jgi:hypothetical protein
MITEESEPACGCLQLFPAPPLQAGPIRLHVPGPDREPGA